MGLDMYLNAKRYISQYNDNDKDLGNRLAKEFPELTGLPIKEVCVEALYWRKANAIHKWFVDNVQEGEDDCKSYYVSREKLAELRDLILEVIDTENTKLLPPTQGFFFGSHDVDEWYWESLKHTVKQLASILEEYPREWEFEYHSSW